MEIYVSLTIFSVVLMLFSLLEEPDRLALEPGGEFNFFMRGVDLVVRSGAAIVLVAMWFLTAFRGIEIGNDTQNYIYYYNVFQQGINPASRFEIGFQVLCYWLGSFGVGDHGFLVIVATGMYLGLLFQVLVEARNPGVAQLFVLCYFLSPFMKTLRQGIATVIVLFAFSMLKRQHDYWFIGLVLLAAQFHTTALVVLVLLFRRIIPIDRNRVLVVAGVIAVLAMSGVLSGVLEGMAGSYAHYFSGRYAEGGWLAVGMDAARSLVLFIAISARGAKGVSRDPLVLMLFASMLVVTSLGFAVNLFTRAAEYFLSISALSFPNHLYEAKDSNRKPWLLLVGTGNVVIFLLVLALRPEWNHLYPYVMWR